MNDLILNNQLDLEFSGGDLVVSPSREQHILLLLKSLPGHWRQSPLSGIGIEGWINAPASDRERNALGQAIRRQLDADGLKPGIINIDSKFNISIA